MSYIGNEPTSVAFLTDTFSGNGSTTAFTLSAAPAGTSSILVAITGVVQDPSTYSVVGTTLTFSPAPPTGTGNISVRFLGIPASGVTTTAYRTVTEFTATAGQTTFSVPSYTVGFIDVYRNGVLLGSADYTASNGVSVVLASGATAGDLVEVISMQVSSVLNAIPSSPASVGTSNLVNGAVTMAKLDSIAQYTGFKNRIINGDMQIDQRNNGASVTNSTGNIYTLDRWLNTTVGSNCSVQQVTGSTGNNTAIRVTGASGNATTQLSQRIESANIYDCAGQTVTVSFTISGSIAGSVSVRFLYPTATNNFTTQTEPVSGTVVNFTTTPTRYTVTRVLDANANKGLNVVFERGATGAGVTWTLEDVQLERGSTATSFDVLDYGTELAMCQRYCVVYGGSGIYETYGYGNAVSTGTVQTLMALPVSMRTTPSISVSGSIQISDGANGFVIFVLSVGTVQSNSQQIVLNATSSGLTQFRTYRLENNNNTTSRIFFIAEL